MHYNDLSTDWWWLLKSHGLNTTQNTQYESIHTSWVITDIEVVMSVKTSYQLMSVYKLINIEVAMSVKYPINWCARTSSLWLTVKFLLLSQFEQQKFRKKKNISHINEYPTSLSMFLAHLSRRLTRWAYSIPMVRRPSVGVVVRRRPSSSVVVRRRPHFQTWISLKQVGQCWSNFMCSITGVGERLHKVLGRIGSKLWFPWQQKAPIDL